MKLTIFIKVLVLKSNETWKFDISGCHSLFEDVFKVSALSFHTSSKSFDIAHYGIVDGVLWKIIPYCLRYFLQLVNGIWLGFKCLVAFKHSSPDMIIKRIKV